MLAILLAALALSEAPPPIDFDAVDRTLSQEPTYQADPLYGMFLFGEAADVRVWAVLDKSSKDAKGYDWLYLDLDADGILGEDGERHAARWDQGKAIFELKHFPQPGSRTLHSDFRLTWTESAVRYSMLWEGKTKTMGGYGPTSKSYATFGKTPEEAPIYVPGFDRPLEFEHWMSGELKAGREKSFKVFVGARGSRVGAFSCGDEDFLPKGEYVLATLIYRDAEGKQRSLQSKLEERC